MSLSRSIARFGALAVVGMAKHANLDLGQKLMYGIGGGLAAGIPAYALTKMHGIKEREHARNLGFGAGVATGVAAPRIIQGLYDIARNSGLVPAPQQGSLA